MNIAIIGGGFTGLAAAYEILKSGHSVTIFEKSSTLGGLASGFRERDWSWSLEYFYHHFFTNDDVLVKLAKELGMEKDILILRPITATRIKNIIYQLDSPVSLFALPFLSPLDKLRTAVLLAFCKLNPFWQPLEKITAEKFFKSIGGSAGWRTLWQPLMKGKFGNYAGEVPTSWLWARFHKRTMKLGYFRGGFRTFVTALVDAIKKRGGVIHTNTSVVSIKQDVRSTKYEVRKKQNDHSNIVNHKSYFDKILITAPSIVATKLVQFPKHYELKLHAIKHLWAQTLILETKEPVLHSTYWLNITDRSFPFIAVVAHTNMADKKYYGGHHVTYVGNYLPEGHPYLTMTKHQLLKIFLPYLQIINPSFNFELRTMNYKLFTAPAAQPVHTLNYSQKAPKIQTPIDGIYLANLDSIYPWDRGTNYAVELGQRAAAYILSDMI